MKDKNFLDSRGGEKVMDRDPLLKKPVVDFSTDKVNFWIKDLVRPFALHLFNAILTTIAPHGILRSVPQVET